MINPTASGTLTVSVTKPGKYEYLCTVPGHAAAEEVRQSDVREHALPSVTREPREVRGQEILLDGVGPRVQEVGELKVAAGRGRVGLRDWRSVEVGPGELDRDPAVAEFAVVLEPIRVEVLEQGAAQAGRSDRRPGRDRRRASVCRIPEG